MAYAVSSHVIANNSLYLCAYNIIKILAELGRFCGHESRRNKLYYVHC